MVIIISDSRSLEKAGSDVDGKEAQPGPSHPESGSNKPKAVRFIGQLNVTTPAGYSQLLEIEFEPSIAAETHETSQTENTIRMDRVRVTAFKMMAPKTLSDTISKSKIENLMPYFVNEATTITVGGSGGRFYGPRNFKPTADNFYASRTISVNRGWGIGGQATYPSSGGLGANYNRSSGVSDSMIARSIGFEFLPWASDPGCKSWKYKIKRIYETELEFSEEKQPVHEAMLDYDANADANFPTHLIVQAETEFRKSQGFRYRAAVLGFKNAMFSVYIRHIKLCLEARIKRMEPEDYYRIPGSLRQGAVLCANLVFDQVKTEEEKIRGEERTIGVETDLKSKLKV